jgi:hypothetical protein
MKTLRIALIAVIVACAMASPARADNVPDEPGIWGYRVISIEKVLHIPGLAAAVREQVNLNDVLLCPSKIFVANVKYKSVIYKISGTKEQWLEFFWRKGVRQASPLKERGIE